MILARTGGNVFVAVKWPRKGAIFGTDILTVMQTTTSAVTVRAYGVGSPVAFLNTTVDSLPTGVSQSSGGINFTVLKFTDAYLQANAVQGLIYVEFTALGYEGQESEPILWRADWEALCASVAAIDGRLPTQPATLAAQTTAQGYLSGIRDATGTTAGSLADVKAVTDNLPNSGALTTIAANAAAAASDANGAHMDTASLLSSMSGVVSELGAVKAVTDNLPDAGALSTIGGHAATAATDAAAVKVVTDALPNAGALTDLASASDVTAIKAVTDLIPADIGMPVAAIKAVTDTLAVPAGGLTAMNGTLGSAASSAASAASSAASAVTQATLAKSAALDAGTKADSAKNYATITAVLLGGQVDFGAGPVDVFRSFAAGVFSVCTGDLLANGGTPFLQITFWDDAAGTILAATMGGAKASKITLHP